MQGFRLDMLADLSDAGRCGVVWSAVSLLRDTEPAVRAHLERGDTAAIVVMWVHEATVSIDTDDSDGSSSDFDPPYGARLFVAAWVARIRWRGPNDGYAEVWIDKGTGVARQRRRGRRSSAHAPPIRVTAD
jgi:hypothetical protein